MQHVDLYVNEWTRNLGETGRRALDAFAGRAASVGVGITTRDDPARGAARLEIFAG